MSALPAIGARVRVLWGLSAVEGEVIDAYDSGYGPQVMVSITSPSTALRPHSTRTRAPIAGKALISPSY